MTADELMAAVRVHADRVHDAVRRLGAPPEAATQVVLTSAVELVDTVAARPESVPDPVGWWFARARALGRTAVGAGADDELPVGGGVLGGDANQLRLAQALENRPERDRAALLLRDSYDLPATAVGTALGVDPATAMEIVGAARLAFLPALLGGAPVSVADHSVDLGALARLGEGGAVAARDATTRRHVQSCSRCTDVLDAQERARRLLSGLTVVAMPDAAREELLGTVQARAQAALPAAVPEEVEEYDDEDDELRRPYSRSLLTLGLLAAIGIGVGIGIAANRDVTISPAQAVQGVPHITEAPALTAPPRTAPTPVLTPSVSPTPRVYVITPSPTPTPTDTATASAQPTVSLEPLSLELVPSTGPNETEMTVNGRGWNPGSFVTVEYHLTVGNGTGSTATVLVDERGRFTTLLAAHDPNGLPGAHQVTADDGAHQASATFTATN